MLDQQTVDNILAAAAKLGMTVDELVQEAVRYYLANL